jgi:hypothetical protein
MDGGGSAVGPPYIRPLQREGTSPTQLIIALMEVGTSPTLRSRHPGGPASHLSFNSRPQAGGGFFCYVMAGLDPAISSRALEEITGSSPVMTWK